MKDMRIFGMMILLILILTLSSPASMDPGFQASSGAVWNMNLRVLVGTRVQGKDLPKAVTASYPSMKYLLSVNLKTEHKNSEEESAALKKIFNLSDIRLLTETVLTWNESDPKGASHFFRLDGREFTIRVTRDMGKKPGLAFRIVVNETPQEAAAAGKGESRKPEPEKGNLLETEFVFPKVKSLILFGFEDKEGNPSFVSLSFAGGVVGGVVGGPIHSSVFAPVRAVGDVKAPKLVHMVEPIYPDEAKKMGIEGTVILECTTDEKGKVIGTRLLRSIPQLDQAAIDAVRQWVYEPVVISGKPIKIAFTITVRFDLRDTEGKNKSIREDEKDVIRAKGDIIPPKLIDMVEPVYPDKARKKGIEGTVILECTVDEKGKVIDAKILRSIPGLDQAAIDAVRKWTYEPVVVNGKPSKIIFTATVSFRLKDDETLDKKIREFEKDAVRAEGDIMPPKLVEQVDPIYPAAARDARIQGTVILSVKADEQGRIIDVLILRSVPELDEAAVAAVRQWQYEPLRIDGKPKKVVFTVTVRFQLKS